MGCFEGETPWRPDIDDGDCARVEAELSVAIEWSAEMVYASAPGIWFIPSVPYEDLTGKQAARRYAVLMLASALGSTLEDANLDS